MNPLVTVIMGAYNCETTLHKAIDSIIAQTYTNWEFVICDDCSTDKTIEILKEYEQRDSRIKALHNETNKKLAASLNACLAVAKGEYIARMDADDECFPNRFEKQVAFLENNPEIDVVGSSMLVFDEFGEKGIRRSIKCPSEECLLKGAPFFHPTIMMKKSVYDELKGYKCSKLTKRSQDLDLWFRFYEHKYKGDNIQEPLYKYREGKKDFKKRSIAAGYRTMLINLNGFKRLHFPFRKRVWAVKPFISALIPNCIIGLYHTLRLKKEVP